MQFSTDQRYAATLAFLADVRDYIARWPAHPMNREMIQRIDAHLAEPTHHLVRTALYARSGGTFTPAGLCVLRATIKGDVLTVSASPKSECVAENILLRRLRRGAVITMKPDESA